MSHDATRPFEVPFRSGGHGSWEAAGGRGRREVGAGDPEGGEVEVWGVERKARDGRVGLGMRVRRRLSTVQEWGCGSGPLRVNV